MRTLKANLILPAVGLGLLALSLASAQGENWPQWRGPLFNGSSPETSLPTKFSKTDHVKWSASMPGPSAATPIIWGDRVFVNSVDQQKKALLALCFDRKTGKMLWEREVAPGSS